MDQEIKKLKTLLRPLGKKALGTYLFGSVVEGTNHPKSDIDICVVAGKKKDELYKETNMLMAKHPNLDIKLFEELPLYLKNRVMEKGVLLYSADELELGMYLRFYRRLWNEQAITRLGYAKATA
ncbi:MAG: nucleotidyltransferase domain-containing protein [Candidatus Diapherotrites archaeon]|nr:nucleotidyltransferase domain-containing protein [Candidatus Diapherotrites archaeon]